MQGLVGSKCEFAENDQPWWGLGLAHDTRHAIRNRCGHTKIEIVVQFCRKLCRVAASVKTGVDKRLGRGRQGAQMNEFLTVCDRASTKLVNKTFCTATDSPMAAPAIVAEIEAQQTESSQLVVK